MVPVIEPKSILLQVVNREKTYVLTDLTGLGLLPNLLLRLKTDFRPYAPPPAFNVFTCMIALAGA